MVIIDATDCIVGRLATHVASLARRNTESIEIINCDKAVYSGSRPFVLASFKRRIERTVPLQGPYMPRQSDQIVKRSIRGMLGYKTPRGREALARIKCYSGIPAGIDATSAVRLEHAHKDTLQIQKTVRVKVISEFLGGRR